MTNQQRQHLMAYLGYYVSDITDTWTQECRVACRAFQEDYQSIAVDGYAGPETDKALIDAVAHGMPAKKVEATGSYWDEIEYFKREEFRCKCGGRYCSGFPAEPKETLVRIADQLRKNLGVPITVISGLRCETWNSIQGGVENSQHKYGEAADIYARGISQAAVEAELDAIGGVRYHYPISGSSNVHFDVPKGSR